MGADEFAQWLEENKLTAYPPAFEKEGYDGLDILLSLSEEELEELASTLKMKKGHRIRLPLAVSKARQRAEDAAEEKRKIKKKRNRGQNKRKNRTKKMSPRRKEKRNRGQ